MFRAPARGRRPSPASGPRSRRTPRGTRRALLVLAAAVLLPATVAAAGVLDERLQDTRAEGREVKQQITVVDRRQQVVVRQISSLNKRIAELDRPIGELTVRVNGLERQIADRERRIAELRVAFTRQASEIARLNVELTAARELLATRMVAAYMGGEAGMLEQLASAGDLSELFERQDALGQVVGLDDRVIDRIAETERTVRIKRARNHDMRRQIATDIEEIDADRAELASKRADLQARRDEIDGVRAERDAMLAALRDREAALGSKLDDLEEDARVLKEAIETGQTTYGGSLPGMGSGGLMWPVSGPVVSPFGPRWGRLHAGIDIAVPAGVPIHAAAGGIVTYAGWMSGYGNLVIVQHGGDLSTAYAHQSQIASSVGQAVGQGQVIGFIGCTGHCFGDHLHFETRIGGSAVDPMGFL